LWIFGAGRLVGRSFARSGEDARRDANQGSAGKPQTLESARNLILATFGVNHWVGGAVGVVRGPDGSVPRWDELLKCKCDIDATLQELMDNRLVWNEARFCFVQERDKNLGGNSLFRSAERIAAEKRHLKRKWQAHIRFESYRSQDRVAMDAPRRQSVKL